MPKYRVDFVRENLDYFLDQAYEQGVTVTILPSRPNGHMEVEISHSVQSELDHFMLREYDQTLLEEDLHQFAA